MIPQKMVKVILTIPLVLIATGHARTFGEGPYKQERQEKRSLVHRSETKSGQSFNGLKQKTDNLDTMNQNPEGRGNALSSEKDKSKKPYAKTKAKQFAMKKENKKQKNRTASQEVANRKVSSKTRVAKSSKPSAKKASSVKTAKKNKTGAKSAKAARKDKPGTKSVKKTQKNKHLTAQKSANKRVASVKAERTEDITVQEPQSLAPRVPAEPVMSISEKQDAIKRETETVGELDVKRINEKGIEYGKQGKYDAAIKEFQKVAAVEPNMPNIHYNLGLAYKKKGMRSEAEREFGEYERLKGQAN